MVMGLYELQFALLFCEERFDVLGGLVVHDVHLGFESLRGEVIKLHFICVENAFIFQVCYRRAQDCVGFIMVYDEKTYASIEGYK